MTTSPSLTTPTSETDLHHLLRTQLSMGLRGMSAPDLKDLAKGVAAELELRVGTALSAGLTNAQLAEFQALIDDEDDDGCTRWLATAVPNYPLITARLQNELVAETIARVSSADPRVLRGTRRVEELAELTLDMLEHYFLARYEYYTRTENSILISFTADEGTRELRVAITLERGLLVVQAHDAHPYPQQARAVIDAFVSEWNRTRWLPKAYYQRTEDGWVQVYGEFVLPVTRGITPTPLDSVLDAVIDTMDELFEVIWRYDALKLSRPPTEDALR